MAVSPPISLIRYIAEHRCVLFVGAGLSAGAGLPGWGKLLSEMVNLVRDDAPDRPDQPQLKSLLASGRFLQVADYCRERLGEARYTMFLKEQLKPRGRGVLETHQIITRLPFRAVITTNYDKLLETAYTASRDGDTPSLLTHDDEEGLGLSLFDNPFFILKAHGDIARPETIVLTSSDYRTITHERPAFNAVFSALLMTNAILFLGYSISDPDLNLLLDGQLSVFKNTVPPRYALMEDAGDVAASVLRRSAGIDVQSYPKGQHESVLEYLKALETEVAKRQASSPPSLASSRSLSPAFEVSARSVIIASPGSRSIVPPKIPLKTAALTLAIRGIELDSRLHVDNDLEQRGRTPVPPRKELEPLLGSALATWQGATPDARKVGDLLAASLPSNVTEALKSLTRDTVVVLDLSPDVENLPWEWLVLDGERLCLRNPLVRKPINMTDAARGTRAMRPLTRLLLIGDTVGNMPGARREVESIAEAYKQRPLASCTLLIEQDATCDAVLSFLETEDYDIVHFAGHAWYDQEEAYLMCHGHELIRARELQSFLSRRRPPVVFLNSHYTAFVPPGVRERDKDPTSGAPLRGDWKLEAGPRGMRGFTGAALAAGVGVFTGCFGSPSDEGGTVFGLEFHKALLEEKPAAQAFFEARRETLARGQEQGDTSALVYTISGQPDLALPSAT